MTRRRFSDTERQALFLAADGKCQMCGGDLGADWEADHVEPFSVGGATDVVNGQALCAPCNRRKGAALDPLRPWQRRALNEWNGTGYPFLAVATPGAGKTKFALTAAAERSGQLIVVVPTSRLRTQWAAVAAEFGIHLDPEFANSTGQPAADMDGVVVTYQSVASNALIYRRLTAGRDTMVILDEVHHCGDEKSWGESIREAFEPATRILMLSGTPFRSDSNPIPFVRYQGEPPMSKANYRYGYSSAVRDGVVRVVEFACHSATARWADAGTVTSGELESISKQDEGRALSSALEPTSDFIRSVLPAAHDRLLDVRREMPDAGGLILAKNQKHAHALARVMRDVCGEPVPVAVSDDPDAQEVIGRFAESTAPWLVAVSMVSEGVDIPRLAVGVYATHTRTETFFQQAIGRFVRTRGDETDSCSATIFLPSTPTLLEMARTMEEERDHVLREMDEMLDRYPVERDGQLQVVDLVEPLPAIHGRHLGTIRQGEHYSDEELRAAMAMMAEVGIVGGSTTATQIAEVMRRTTPKTVGRAVITNAPKDTQTRSELKAQKRADCNRLVRRIADRTGMHYGDVWKRVNRGVGENSIKEATVESLDLRIQFLVDWLERA